ncbi:MAG: DNA mismatch repair protein MutS [Gloeomargaritaceae cyanobacterium C42_A2020_066]|nr:DNA mismatch repair protein MutS [Gloeomargaritaceae cyanobacterium C42_A2020_066]
MLRHYCEVKDDYPHALLLYRVGDFFETFFLDALTIARELELYLTSKHGGKDVGPVPMAGVPQHALERYASQLLQKGYAVAICDQVEDAAIAERERRMVRRAVTRVLTPGTVLEENLLTAKQNNFLAAVILAGQHWGLAFADISTGEFTTTQATDPDTLTQELLRLQPAEILFPTDHPDLVSLLRPGEAAGRLPEALPPQFGYTLRLHSTFQLGEARQRLLETFGLRSLEGLGCAQLPLAIQAAGALVAYLEETQRLRPVPLQLLTTYTLSDYLVLDHQTRRNLELTQTVRDGSFHGSLLWALDRTVTAMGGRALRRWLLQPLLDLRGIMARQDTIQELVDQGALRTQLQQHLRAIYDLERLVGRVMAGSAHARDLVALADSLAQLPLLAQVVATAKAPYLVRLQQVPPELEHLGEKLRAWLVATPPPTLGEGGLIRPGVHPPLDQLRQELASDQAWIADLEVRERQRTNIPSLKVGYNKTFGYYISLTRAKTSQAPEDYVRKQTLSNEERYITPDLKEREVRILGLQEEIQRLEYDLFQDLRVEVAAHGEAIRTVALAVAAADALASLAEVAIYQGYSRPAVTAERDLWVTAGRHPVVEQLLPAGCFVPNDVHLGDPAGPDLVVLTGPNASGKSCYLRQVGLIQLLAQVGSFVPAAQARLGLCDRIFTRVGAVDDLAMGQSTFMVEMCETANILHHATPRSLVLLDEIGRGTATFDGLAIAWSVAEHLASQVQARTLFATHYHELNELAGLLENVANFQVTVKELPDRIVFLHQVQPGGADKSYGIEAGRLAGLPPTVIERAREVMIQIEKHSRIAVGLRRSQRPAGPAHGTATEQLGIFNL